MLRWALRSDISRWLNGHLRKAFGWRAPEAIVAGEIA